MINKTTRAIKIKLLKQKIADAEETIRASKEELLLMGVTHYDVFIN